MMFTYTRITQIIFIILLLLYFPITSQSATKQSVKLNMPDLVGKIEKLQEVKGSLEIQVEGELYVVSSSTHISLCGKQVTLEELQKYQGASVNITIQDFQLKSLSKVYILCE